MKQLFLNIIDYKIKIISLSPLNTLVVLESESIVAIGITKEHFIYNFKKLYNRSSKEYILIQCQYNDIYWHLYISQAMITDIIDDLIPLPVET
jgi:hypothetical protein